MECAELIMYLTQSNTAISVRFKFVVYFFLEVQVQNVQRTD